MNGDQIKNEEQNHNGHELIDDEKKENREDDIHEKDQNHGTELVVLHESSTSSNEVDGERQKLSNSTEEDQNKGKEEEGNGELKEEKEMNEGDDKELKEIDDKELNGDQAAEDSNGTTDSSNSTSSEDGIYQRFKEFQSTVQTMSSIGRNNNNVSQHEQQRTMGNSETEEEKKLKELQKNEIKELMKNDKLMEGENYYVLNARWWNKWKQYVNFEWVSSYAWPHPGEIDNSALLDSSGKIKRNLNERYEYLIVGVEIWNKLKEWYKGGPDLPKICIRTRFGGLTVEIRQLEVKLIRSDHIEEPIEISCSKTVTVGHFLHFLVQQLNLDPTKIRLWDFYGNEKRLKLTKYNDSLADSGIHDGQSLLIEMRKENGKWPSKKFYKKTFSGYNFRRSTTPTDPGKTGLFNLGNTCFMNSALQCLSNTPPLCDYFLSKQFKIDMDSKGENPLSMKGQLAEEYYHLLTELWSSHIGCSEPREFKRTIGKFAPQFSGYDQHDSQEFLSFLLDGLHEDLNRVKKKPYVATVESNGREDLIVSKEAWEAHKKRNDSIIVDLFQGQLKSTVTCPRCHKKSKTFDPFMYLSVPIPVNKEILLEILVFRLDPTIKPVRYGVTIDKNASIPQLKAALALVCGISDPKSIKLHEFLGNRLRREWRDRDNVDDIMENDYIYAYETIVSENSDDIIISVLQRRAEKNLSCFTANIWYTIPFMRKKRYYLPSII